MSKRNHQYSLPMCSLSKKLSMAFARRGYWTVEDWGLSQSPWRCYGCQKFQSFFPLSGSQSSMHTEAGKLPLYLLSGQCILKSPSPSLPSFWISLDPTCVWIVSFQSQSKSTLKYILLYLGYLCEAVMMRAGTHRLCENYEYSNFLDEKTILRV